MPEEFTAPVRIRAQDGESVGFEFVYQVGFDVGEVTIGPELTLNNPEGIRTIAVNGTGTVDIRSEEPSLVLRQSTSIGEPVSLSAPDGQGRVEVTGGILGGVAIQGGDGGAVGIGTRDPGAPLHVTRVGGAFSGPLVRLQNPNNDPGASVDLGFALGSGPSVPNGRNIAEIRGIRTSANDNNGALAFMVSDDGDLEEQMRIAHDGQVGIGTNAPQATLDVRGDFDVSGGVQVGGDVRVAGDIVLENADLAEDFTILGQSVPGNVMVANGATELRPCTTAYDRRVVGIVAGGNAAAPAVILGRRRDAVASTAPIALVGRVACLVDADHGAIGVGDLLTTSPTPGHAMRAQDRERAFGAVLGKALTPLDTGRGTILVLVALQ